METNTDDADWWQQQDNEAQEQEIDDVNDAISACDAEEIQAAAWRGWYMNDEYLSETPPISPRIVRPLRDYLSSIQESERQSLLFPELRVGGNERS